MTGSDADYTALRNSLDRLDDVGPPRLARQLARLITAIADEAAKRRTFAKALTAALEGVAPGEDSSPSRRGSHRRASGVIDPFAVFEEGEDTLREQLEGLDVEQLKDIIAEHGMDRDKLAMKWKTPERLINRIVETVKSRSAKGDVFMR